ncbi:MAG: hypothetical protein IRY99_04255 [Isosphaeraceae bacterium]|nr:hypothetical protein [Isosphaeraceae bacterium]
MSRRIALSTLAVGLFLAGGLALRSAPPEEPDRLKELAEARMKLARRYYEGEVARTNRRIEPPGAPGLSTLVSRVNAELLALWSRRWMEAQRDASDRKADQIAAIQGHVDRLAGWVKQLQPLTKVADSGVSQTDIDVLEFHLLEAEYWLAKAKGQ